MKPAKPQTDERKVPSTYRVVRHPGAKPGEWQGHYVPVKPPTRKPSK